MGADGAKHRPIKLQVANVGAVIIVIAVNTLVDALPLNGVTTAQVSASYPSLFTPSGYVSAVWGIVYALAILFVLYQLRPSQRNERYLTAMGLLYLAGAVIDSVWLIALHYSYGAPLLYLASTAILLLLLGNLILVYRRLDIGGVDAHRGEKIGVHFPMSVYLGWISMSSMASVASAINIALSGTALEAQEVAAAAMLFASLALTLYMLWLRRDLAFAFVVVWVVSGIAAKQTDPVVHFAALSAMGVAIVAALLTPTLRKMTWTGYYFS